MLTFLFGQVAGLIAQGTETEGPGPVLYVSGEEVCLKHS